MQALKNLRDNNFMIRADYKITIKDQCLLLQYTVIFQHCTSKIGRVKLYGSAAFGNLTLWLEVKAWSPSQILQLNPIAALK